MLHAFGISNYITGIMLILLAVKSRALALTMLAVIPAAYVLGKINFSVYIVPNYPASKALFAGIPIMLGYLGVCVFTFVAGLGVALYRKHVINR